MAVARPQARKWRYSRVYTRGRRRPTSRKCVAGFTVSRTEKRSAYPFARPCLAVLPPGIHPSSSSFLRWQSATLTCRIRVSESRDMTRRVEECDVRGDRAHRRIFDGSPRHVSLGHAVLPRINHPDRGQDVLAPCVCSDERDLGWCVGDK